MQAKNHLSQCYLQTSGMTPWTEGRPFARLTSPQDKEMSQAYFLASSGIRNHNLSVAAMKFIDRAATRFG